MGVSHPVDVGMTARSRAAAPNNIELLNDVEKDGRPQLGFGQLLYESLRKELRPKRPKRLPRRLQRRRPRREVSPRLIRVAEASLSEAESTCVAVVDCHS